MNTYNINGKEYTEFDINKRCAELMAMPHEVIRPIDGEPYIYSHDTTWGYEPFSESGDAWDIIEKAWDELEGVCQGGCETVWNSIIDMHKCSKTAAACICFIENNKG